MNIATINNTLFPIILFIIYFIIASVIRYNLKDKVSALTPVKKSQQFPEIFTYKEAFSAYFDPELEEEIPASVQLKSVEDNVAPVVTQKPITQSSSPITASEVCQSIPEIIDRLGKRELRKLCSRKALNIQQKTNGIELTVDLLKASVKKKFKENPFQVIQLIGEHLPYLLPILPKSNQQQQLEKKAC